MFTVSKILVCSFFCLSNGVVMRYMFLQLCSQRTDGKHLDFLFSSSGAYIWITIIYIQKGKE